MERLVGNGYRCGWRFHRFLPGVGQFDPFVEIARGKWRLRVAAYRFDGMDDAFFARFMEIQYRESMFEQLQQDLDVLAQYLIDTGITWNGLAMDDGVPTAVREALERYEARKKDTQA